MKDKRIEIVEAFAEVIRKYNDYLDIADPYTMAEDIIDFLEGDPSKIY